MDSTRDPAALARRLRQLRKEHWSDRPLTQQDLADVFGVVLSSVSSWENPRSAKIPPTHRLTAYATLFATRRSIERGIRLLGDDELTAQEKAERDRLTAEFEQLRLAATGGATEFADDRPRSLWHFPDSGPVRLICGTPTESSPFASARHHNYMQLAGYGDLDAMVELYGHLRYENPGSDVEYELAARLESDDLTAHVVLLGSGAMNHVAKRIVGLVDLPLRQVPDPEIKDGEVFELSEETSRRFRPKFAGDDSQGEVTEDVGMFFRTPNPNNIARTLTVCSGVFTRGVYGAVRFLTDDEMRDENHSQLANLFGDARTFGLLMRVPVFDHATSTPDLRHPAAVLHSWSVTA